MEEKKNFQMMLKRFNIKSQSEGKENVKEISISFCKTHTWAAKHRRSDLKKEKREISI